jgi:hypothetical protein
MRDACATERAMRLLRVRMEFHHLAGQALDLPDMLGTHRIRIGQRV